MATSLTAMAARRAADLARATSSISASRASSLISRRGLSGAADHHGPAKINIWQDPLSPSRWKEEHFVIASLSVWWVLIFGGYKLFSGGEKDKGGVISSYHGFESHFDRYGNERGGRKEGMIRRRGGTLRKVSSETSGSGK